MKTTIFFLSILMFFNPEMSIARQSDALCTTTIKCGNGTSTCTANPEISGGTSSESGTCGTISRKYRVCAWEGFVEPKNAFMKHEKFICCNANGDAVSLSEKSSAEGICASPGTVQ